MAVQLVLLGWTQRLLGAHGKGFLGGDWQARLAARTGEMGSILAALGRELAAPHWLGGWVVFVVVVVVAAVVVTASRPTAARTRALVLATVVSAQLAVYAGVYLLTYLDPMAHLDSSFRRIAAALWPLAAVVVGLGTAPGRGRSEG